MPKKWKVIDSEYIAHEPWFTVRRERLELPSGAVIPSYYVLEYPDWVNVIAVTREGKFIMVKQYRHGLGRTDWELCAGVCEPSDLSVLDAARRELLEETGYGGGQWQPFMTISANPATQTNLTHCFLATGVEKISEPHLDATEDLEVEAITRAHLQQILTSDSIKQALMAAPLWKYFSLY